MTNCRAFTRELSVDNRGSLNLQLVLGDKTPMFSSSEQHFRDTMNIFVAYLERSANYSASKARGGWRISENHGVLRHRLRLVVPYRGNDTRRWNNDGALRAPAI